MSLAKIPKLPLLLLLVLILLLVLAVVPSGDETTGAAAEDERGQGRGDADGVGDTIRTLTARVAEFQRELEALRGSLDESVTARRELARRITQLEEAPARVEAAGTAGTGSLGTLDDTVNRLNRFVSDPLATDKQPEMPVGFGFDPVPTTGSRWVGPAFRDAGIAGLGERR